MDASSGRDVKRYHIECGVSISGSHSRLTTRDFSPELLKQRLEQSKQRRTLGYFIKRKFSPEDVLRELRKYGFHGNNYTRVIVTWGWEEDALKQAKKAGVNLWDFRDILRDIASACRGRKTYFTDDTLRTIQLFQRSGDKK